MTGADIHLLLLSVAHPYGAHVGVGVTQIMTSHMSQIRELAEEKIQAARFRSLACFLSAQHGGMPSNIGRLTQLLLEVRRALQMMMKWALGGSQDDQPGGTEGSCEHYG